jgi:hydrogenase expression/formation protein HypC
MCLGIPGQILAVADPTTHMAATQLSGARRMVDISLVDDEGIAPGDWVLVHAGLALSKVSEQEAHEMLALLQEMSDVFLGGEPAPTP